MRTKMDNELAGTMAGIWAYLAFERTLIGMDPEVLFQAAAVSSGIVTVLALVWLLSSV